MLRLLLCSLVLAQLCDYFVVRANTEPRIQYLPAKFLSRNSQKSISERCVYPDPFVHERNSVLSVCFAQNAIGDITGFCRKNFLKRNLPKCEYGIRPFHAKVANGYHISSSNRAAVSSLKLNRGDSTWQQEQDGNSDSDASRTSDGQEYPRNPRQVGF
jgi:hypothetical protein